MKKKRTMYKESRVNKRIIYKNFKINESYKWVKFKTMYKQIVHAKKNPGIIVKPRINDSCKSNESCSEKVGGSEALELQVSSVSDFKCVT